jgi:undecaprenyl-diphosphatase
MDWAVVHELNELMRSRDGVEDPVTVFASAAVAIYAFAVIALWFVSRPEGVQRLRLACASALASAAAGLIVNQAIGQLWVRDRPYVEHPGSLVLFTPASHDPSFPSDHATAAFAIAVAVVFFHRKVGSAFLVVAAAIAASRVLVGAHYPSDVIAGALVGSCAAVAVCTLGRSAIVRLTAVVAGVTDPLLRAIWQREPEPVSTASSAPAGPTIRCLPTRSSPRCTRRRCP